MKLTKSIYTILTIFLLFIFSKNISFASSYPITPLGNCRDQKECKLYCDIPTNKASCWSYSIYSQSVLGDETPETKLKPLNINFPISELGNCESLIACKEYCNNDSNKLVCKEFAKNKGLSSKSTLIEKAQEELNCSSLSQCRTYCSQEENKTKCSEFAKKYNLKTIDTNNILQKAKEELGCTSTKECRTFCAQDNNKSTCASFQEKFISKNQDVLIKAKEQLGCTSQNQCRAFCNLIENKDKCANFSRNFQTQRINKLEQELGCKTNDECRKICEQSPEKCPNFPKRTTTPREPKQTEKTQIERLRLKKESEQ